MSDALTLTGVSKRFGSTTAVNNVSLRVPRGTVYGFLGPNGAGKTTIIRMIMSIFFPDEGEINVLGQSDSAAVKDQLGYLPEEKGLYKKMKAGELLSYFGQLKGMGRLDADTKARKMLEDLGLGSWVDKRCQALSKGMGQKVQILATLIHDPELVILDEPFSGLDPVNIEVMRDLILGMKRDGRTVIFSTHIMAQAEQICDSILLMNKGNKILDGSLAEVKATGDTGITLDYDGDGAILHQIPNVSRVNDSGKQAEIFLHEGANSQEVLHFLADRLTIRRFDLREPSLHEIFVRAVEGDSHE